MITSIMSSSAGKKAFGSIIRMWLLTLLVLIICTCSGPKLMLGNQTLENQTDYFSYSGKLVKPMHDLTECVILRTDVQDFRLCLQQKPSIWRQLHQMHGTVSCQNLVPMLRKCSQTRSYQYQSTTRSSLNQYKTEWTGQKPNSLIEFQQRNTRVENLKQTKSHKSSTVLTQQ